MKNQQIHQQEKKITDLEKVVGSNKLAQTTKPENNTHTRTHLQDVSQVACFCYCVFTVRFKCCPNCL